LDFANTVSHRGMAEQVDRLRDYADLLAWARQTAALDQPTLERLARQAVAHPTMAAAALGKLREVREVLYRVLAAVGRGEPPSPPDFRRLNLALGGALAHARLVPSGQGFIWGWDLSETDLEAP